MNGILKAVRRNNAVAVAFETSRLRMLRGSEVLSSARVDGWLAINEFSDSPLLAELRARGERIVHVHSRPEIDTGATVLPDNEGGSRSVTEHLIWHGHRRIAFAGNLVHIDVSERHAGYRAALKAESIELEAALLFDTPHHKEVDGRAVAHKLIEMRKAHAAGSGKSAVSALVAATDRLALGALSAFLEAGYRVPEDFAIVGFDDADAAQFADPPLTTVRQSFAEVAACAVTELLAAIREQRAPKAMLRVPTQPVVRRSCGCLLSHSVPPDIRGQQSERIEGLTRELLAQAGRNRLGGVPLADWPEARKIAEVVGLAATGTPSEEVVRSQWWSGFLATKRDAESAVRVMELLEATLRSWVGVPAEGQEKSFAILRDLRVALMHEWQRTERKMVSHYESVTEAAYRLSNAISHSGSDPSQDLSWIRWSNAQHACCALWTDRLKSLEPGLSLSESLAPQSGSSSRMRLTGEYTASLGALPSTRQAPISAAHFPPSQILETAEREGAIVSVASVPRGRGGEFGLLAVVAPLAFEHLEYVGTPGDWAIQLGVALDRAQAERELRASAELDALTGLANRTTLLARINSLRLAKHAPSFALLFIDLDDFKKVNDSLGHDAGDQLLIQIAERLTRQVSGSLDPAGQNLVGRVGGDEFVIVLSGVGNEEATVDLVRALQDRLREPYSLLGRTVFVSASIGVNFGQGVEADAQELLRDADTAMYRAKMQGRARHEIFHRGMHAQAVEKLHLDARLRLAIEQNELELWYQPIINLATGKDLGAEALIRWRNPEQGVLSPARFLAVAEDVGLAIPISEWVIRRACSEVALIERSFGPGLYVNVNVPAAHIKQSGFVEFVEGALAEAKISGRALGIELVESALLDEPAKCAQALTRLRALGVRIAIDDFGTGYSSLAYLRDFPVSTLKIDRSFIQNVPGDSRDNGIARAIIAMGQELGLGIVAEGIETADQMQFLKQAGCDYGQGFLMSMPLEFPVYMARLSAARSLVPPMGSRSVERSSDRPLVLAR